MVGENRSQEKVYGKTKRKMRARDRNVREKKERESWERGG